MGAGRKILMKNILITGFGAFLKHDANPAQEVALSLKKEGYDSVILPVSYEGAIAAFKAIKNIKQYDAILSFGLASSRHFISLETKAYNEMNAIHLDNDGVRKMGEPIIKGAPKELSSPFNVPNLKEYLAKEELRPNSQAIRAATSATKSITLIFRAGSRLFSSISRLWRPRALKKTRRPPRRSSPISERYR